MKMNAILNLILYNYKVIQMFVARCLNEIKISTPLKTVRCPKLNNRVSTDYNSDHDFRISDEFEW